MTHFTKDDKPWTATSPVIRRLGSEPGGVRPILAIKLRAARGDGDAIKGRGIRVEIGNHAPATSGTDPASMMR